MLRQLALSHQLASRYRRPALFRRPVPPSCYIPAGASILFPGAVRHFAVAFGTAPRSRTAGSRHSTPRDWTSVGDAAAPGSSAQPGTGNSGWLLSRGRNGRVGIRRRFRSLSTAASPSQSVEVTLQALR